MTQQKKQKKSNEPIHPPLANQQLEDLRDLALSSLENFIRVLAPHRALGHCHIDIMNWWERPDGSDRQLCLIPRDHQKSAMIAYRVAYHLTKEPWSTFLYVSATATLAEKQLQFIKDIMESKMYRKLFPTMINEQESKRKKWTASEIIVDHPERLKRGVRDSSIFIAGVGKTITGLHFSNAVLDDVVVPDNAYTEESRQKVEAYYSQLASICTTGSKIWIVGTRYHPKDLYAAVLGRKTIIYDEVSREVVGERPLYEAWIKEVEDRGDGTGNFLWPRQTNAQGHDFGFDINILAMKKAEYIDQAQFRAQYYNNPNDPDSQIIKPEMFQYYDLNFITKMDGRWTYKGRPLNIFASIDFATTVSDRADYTAISVIGMDWERNVYVLAIDRFKTDQIKDYYDRLVRLYHHWGFKKIRAEVSAQQGAIVKELKHQYLIPSGIMLSIDEFKPTRHLGSKEERMEAELKPRYENLMVWHQRGGNWQLLEEELMLAKPPHDDIKDSLANAIAIATPPAKRRQKQRESNIPRRGQRNGTLNSFGGF
jgi:hypothetical protein